MKIPNNATKQLRKSDLIEKVFEFKTEVVPDVDICLLCEKIKHLSENMSRPLTKNDESLIAMLQFWKTKDWSSLSQMFFKIGVLKNFAISAGKKPVLEFLFNKMPDLQACSLIKDTPTHLFSYKYCEIFKITFFYETPLVTVSGKIAFLAQTVQPT